MKIVRFAMLISLLVLAGGCAQKVDDPADVQTMDNVRRPSAKIESGNLSDMKAVVFGDTAVVHGLWTKKSSTADKDTSSRSRWADTFVRRDGRWQCVGSYSARAD